MQQGASTISSPIDPPETPDDRPRGRRGDVVTFIVVIVLALGSAYATLRATESGIGLSTDSLRYLNVSRSLLRGDGPTISREKTDEPLTHFAPLYPVAVAVVSKVSRSERRTAAGITGAVIPP